MKNDQLRHLAQTQAPINNIDQQYTAVLMIICNLCVQLRIALY